MFGTTDELRFTVDLSAPLKRRSLEPLLFTEDNAGNTIVLSFVDEAGSAVSVAGYSAELNFIRPDGVTVLIPGVITGDRASFTLASTCLEAPGGAEMHASLSAGTTRKTVWSADAVIHRSATDSYADPSNIIPSLAALLAQYDACVSAAEQANNAAVNAAAVSLQVQAQIAALQAVIEQAQSAGHHYIQSSAPANPVNGDVWFNATFSTWGDADDGTWADAAQGTWADLASPTISAAKVYAMGSWVNHP